MTKPTVTIERCQQIGHQLKLQVALTCPVPPVYPKLSVVFTCGERTRIIPMAFTDSDGTTLRAQKTVELAYVFYEPPVGQPMGITFLYTDGVHGYQPVEPDQPYQVTCPPRRALRHFIRSSKKEKLKQLAGACFSLLALPYRHCKVQPKQVTFLSNRSNRLSGNIKSVFLEMTKVPGVEITVLCHKGNLLHSLPVLRQFLRLYATSKVVFVDDYYHLLSYVKKKPEVQLVQLWHACGAFKTFGYSRQGEQALPQGSPNHRQYDYAIVSSQQVCPCYAEGFGIDLQKVLPLGSPRCDRFADDRYKAAFTKRFYAENPQLADKKIVLFAPTFRGGGQGNCYYPLEKFRPDDLLDALPEDTVLATKMHPYLTERPTCQRAEHANRFIDLTDRYDVNDLLFVSSVLITDYSSVVYEASILNLPMLFYAFDLESYCKERDFYCDYASFVPGRIVRTMEELTHALQTEDYQQEKVAPFYTRNFDDTAGKATQNVVHFAKELLHIPTDHLPL